MKLLYRLLVISIFFTLPLKAQQNIGPLIISGNADINTQFYQEDSAIGSPEVPEAVLSNAYLNLNMSYGKFTAGLRYETYLGPLLGYDPRFGQPKSNGIPYRFASYTGDNLELTAGNFYEQFGNGLILRSYFEPALGIDNSIDGFRAIYRPTTGVALKGLIGRQRFYWELGPGIVRGLDAEFNLNDLFDSLSNSKMRIVLGGSFVSKYQDDQDPLRNLPENVASWAARSDLNYGGWGLKLEYAFKYNDPSLDNGYIYKNGQVFFADLSYTRKGFGARVNLKWLDNMSYRSDRAASVNDLPINFLPAIAKQYTYRLSTLYPYATQATGEYGVGGDLFYKIKAGSVLGGEYGADFSVNFSSVYDIDRTPASNDTLGYESAFLSKGEDRFYDDIGFEYSRKLNKKDKIILSYIYQVYDKEVVEKEEGGEIFAHTGIIEFVHKLTSKKTIRAELQGLFTEQERGSWAMALLEYTVSPHWSVSVFDEWNYGNEDPDRRFHYYNANVAYTKGATRISMGWARQRQGLLCVGGVCRVVPASNGFILNITTRF